MSASLSYKLAIQRLGPSDLALIIDGFYSKPELLQALRRGGFYIKGGRMDSLPRHELVDWMAGAFIEQPDFGKVVASRLDQATLALKAELAVSSPSMFARKLGPLEQAIGEGRLSGAAWALATDGRSEAGRAVERLMTRVARSARTVLGGLEKLEEELRERGELVENSLHGAQDLEGETAEAFRRSERAERRVRRDEKKLKTLREKREEQARLIASLVEERACLRKDKKRLESEKLALGAELENLRRSRPQLREADRRIRELEKEVARLQHERERSRLQEEKILSERSRLEVAEQKSVELARALDEALGRADAERFTYEAVNGDLRAEVARLRARLAKERERRQPTGRARDYREQRVGIFLDMSNLYLSGLEYYRRRIDYQRLTEKILNGRVLAAAIAYNVESARGDKSGLFEVLRGLGYEIRTKNLVVRADGSRKGDWDAGIAADIVERLNSLDVVALGSGDGDFLPVVCKAHERGVSVEIHAFPNTALALKEEADYFPIDESLLIGEISRFARPEESITREEVLKLVHQALGVRLNFLRKLSTNELDQLLRSLNIMTSKR